MKLIKLPQKIEKTRVAKWLLFFNLLFLGIAIYLTRGRINLQIGEVEVHPFDLAVILMATTGVLLTFVTIFVGMIAAWGYNAIMDIAGKSATDAALSKFEMEKENIVNAVLKVLDDRKALKEGLATAVPANETAEENMIKSLMSGDGK